MNLLKNASLDVVGWWDRTRNEPGLWETVTVKARRTVWWQCPHGHSFTAAVYEMTDPHGVGCPVCWQVERDERAAQWDAIKGLIVSQVPELVEAWDNPEPPQGVPVSTRTPYYFRCSSGHRTRRTPERWLDLGCSTCKSVATRAENKRRADADPTASRLSPEISSQWHPTRNEPVALAHISPGSVRIMWWRDPVCGHEFQDTPRDRDKYARLRCPVCETILDSLAYHYPDVAQEWAPENALSAWHVRPTTTTLAETPWWICRRDPKHRWQAPPSARINGAGCPECRMTGKSQIELLYHKAAQEQWGSARSGARIQHGEFANHAAWSVDVLVEMPGGRTLVIEYDGSYWHRDKAETDTEKSLDLLAAGYLVVRVREAPLESLGVEHPNYHEIVAYSGAQEPESDVVRIEEWAARRR